MRLDEWTTKGNGDAARLKASADIAECISRKRTALELRECDLSDLPKECWTALAHLRKLALERVTGIPENIIELHDLEKFALTGSPLETLPDAIGHLTKLKYLALSDNGLIGLPASIGNLRELGVLVANRNQLKSLPESLGALSSLTRLELRYNRLARLPETLGDLQALEVLYADHNQLIALPESVCALRKITRFDLNDNLLEQVPQEIGALAKLQCITLHNNLLDRLPDSVRKLSVLQYLFARANRLKDLPEGLWDLPELRLLSLDNNRLTDLSNGIARLRGTTEVSVRGNPIPEERIIAIHEELCNSGIRLYSDFPLQSFGVLTGEPATPQAASRDFGEESAAEMEKMLKAFQTGEEENRYQRAFFILLAKLVRTRDFELNRGGASRRVQNVVDALYRDTKLRAECFAVAEAATSSCADSAEAMLQALETTVLCNDIRNGKYTAQEAYGLGLRHFRLDVVKQIASRKIQSTSANDPLEVHLAYATGLRMKLQLPTHGVDMQFRTLSGVTDDDLASACEEVRRRESANGGEEFFRYLCEWAPWVSLIRTRNETAFTSVEKEFDLKMDALYESRNDLSGNAYLQSVEELTRQRSAAVKELVGKVTALCRKEIERAEFDAGLLV